MESVRGRLVAIVALACLVLSCTAALAEDQKELPKAVQDAVKKAFPDATIEDVEREKEHGITIYELELVQDEEEFEAEFSAEGVLMETETEVSLEDVPEKVKKIIEDAAGEGRVTEVEKVELRAKVRDGKVTLTYRYRRVR